MGGVRVVTDSTADLLPEWRQELGIEMVPLHVHFGEEQYLDQVELGSDRFFERLGAGGVLPRTSQPAPAAFLDVYRRLAEEADAVVSIHISERLSGTLASARTAREMLPDADIRVVDSRLASVALGLVVLRAARVAAAGGSADEVVAEAERAAAATWAFMALDTLEFLEKNGRIGKAQAWVGTLLAVKPVITLEDGAVAPASRVRGQRQVIPELVRLFERRLGDGARAEVIVAHGGAPEAAQELAEALRATGRVSSLRTTWVGPVIGSHTGPRVLGFGCCALP